MKQAYKVTYKLLFNEQLKKVSYLGVLTHPLYIQITYKRKTTNIKSSYFDILASSLFHSYQLKQIKIPSIEKIIILERELIDFTIEKLAEGFSLESFRNAYEFYGTNICDELEKGFRVYLFMHFNEKGLGNLGKSIAEGSEQRNLYLVLQEMKKAIKPEIYNLLIKNSFSANQPFLPLYDFFLQSNMKVPFINIMQFQKPSIQSSFNDFINSKYNKADCDRINKGLNFWLDQLENYANI
ncbi:MAG: hypothetical protein P0Y49_14275 [Candidatus Pedobacter colombiensis]|uniref:Uncharacterized protein n=1 Tax=Candidatus Pedobacter colombiensis TaxID=3121371 RepID=A0AAJ5W4L4_9SPHI|nr:hypothetical protein [Pedobacter sp.]WEK17964.1 MAG: hypothetical protein P0Y49_14275 [Pedobacter sp.]